MGSVVVLVVVALAVRDGATSGVADPSARPLPSTVAVTEPSPHVLEPTPLATPTPGPAHAPLLPRHRIVAFYGNPLAASMGVLGDGPPEQMLDRLARQADAYAVADRTRNVLPALQLVTPAAQSTAGEDGLYRARMPPSLIDQVAGWAERRNYLLILDLQVGRSTVDAEIEVLRPYLRRPYVHLALDPEFAWPASKEPVESIGTLDASHVNGAVRTLSRLVDDYRLPPKILIVHRFTDGMLTRSHAIESDPNVQVVTTMDGFAAIPLKLAQYATYVHDQRVQFAGIKLFFKHDVPLLTPDQVVDLDPFPDVVIYQ